MGIPAEEALHELRKNLTLSDRGVLSLYGERAIIAPMSASGAVMSEMSDIVGLAGTRAILYGAGYRSSQTALKILKERTGFTEEDLARCYASATSMSEGWGYLNIVELDILRGRIRATVENSPFVEVFHEGAESPVCSYLAGVVSSILHSVGGPRSFVREIRCVARGDEVCEFSNELTV